MRVRMVIGLILLALTVMFATPSWAESGCHGTKGTSKSTKG